MTVSHSVGTYQCMDFSHYVLKKNLYTFPNNTTTSKSIAALKYTGITIALKYIKIVGQWLFLRKYGSYYDYFYMLVFVFLIPSAIFILTPESIGQRSPNSMTVKIQCMSSDNTRLTATIAGSQLRFLPEGAVKSIYHILYNW